MVLIEQSIEEAEASCPPTGAGAGAGAVATPRKRIKRPLYLVIKHAYVYEKIRNKLAPWIQENEEDGIMPLIIKELAEDLSPHMHLAVPKKKHIEPQPAYMLRFVNFLPAEVFTNQPLVGADDNPLQIELVNIESGEICTGALSSVGVEIFVSTDDFPSENQNLSTCYKALSPRNKAAKPLLVQISVTRTARKGLGCENKFVVKLHNGRAAVRGKITDNSSWVWSGMFKLVARAVKGSYEGISIKEALSNAFPVLESKVKGRRKHEIPSPEDPTWRLINVGNEYVQRLQDIGISTVKDFLKELNSDPNRLKRKLGMQSAKWESTVEHARKCQISEDDVNIFNFEGNGLSDSVSPNLDVQPGNIEDANLNHMGTGGQMAPESNSASDQMERAPSNTSYNGNDEPIQFADETFEGMGEYSTIHPNFGRLESNRWKHDFNYPELDEGANSPLYFTDE